MYAALKVLTRLAVVAWHSGLDEVDDTVADWEASRLAGGFLGARRRSRRSCLAKPKKKEIPCQLLFVFCD